MEFNYQREKRKYIKIWEKLEAEYRRAGMSEQDIEKMKSFDWEIVKQERIFCIHNQYLECLPQDSEKDGSGRENPLCKRFADKLSCSDEDEYFARSRYDWIENLENENLARRIKSMNKADIELLTMYIADRKTHAEIAKILGVDRTIITRRIGRIKNFLKR